ncbi:hypothetical protein [Mycobacterium sp. 155]|uniref:hypothetical protein n=1 Tax=Mycobacterium sp. 155 TaxID=1157943 RepID=UPI0003795B6E|nr:hypothetical protein [Mycobacterium sp. 155]
MTDPWPTDVLDRFGTAEEIEISTRRVDGSLRGDDRTAVDAAYRAIATTLRVTPQI